MVETLLKSNSQMPPKPTSQAGLSKDASHRPAMLTSLHLSVLQIKYILLNNCGQRKKSPRNKMFFRGAMEKTITSNRVLFPLFEKAQANKL